MSKQDEYRISLRFDKDDEDHRKVCAFLNSLNRKKARYIVKAVLAYWSMGEKGPCLIEQREVLPESSKNNLMDQQKEKMQMQEEHFVSIDGDEEVDTAEVSLMLKNYKMFENMEEI